MEENLTNKRFSTPFVMCACIVCLILGRWTGTKGSNMEGLQ